jgi:hypothetical protein
MASAPLKRVYFDTNILFHWPHIPNNVRSIFGVAKWVGAELYMPTVVESELEAQYVREVDAVYGSLASNWKTLDALCHGVIAVDLNGSRPSTDDLRESFRVTSEQLKTYYGLSNIPLTTVTLDTFVDMAINRRAPFEEYEVASRKTQVVGLQDAAILFSIIDHMKTAQEGDRCALVSEDGIFHKAETRKLLENAGVKLQLFKNVRTLFNDLWDHVWEAIRTPWRAEIRQVGDSLNEQKDQLAEKIFPLLVASELGRNISKRAKEIKGFRVTEFRSAETELPASEHLPPDAATYARPEGSTVSISARASTQIDAVVETLNWFSLGFLIGQPRAPDEPPPAPKIEDAQLSEALNVSLNGTVRNGVIGDFEVTDVEAARP